jgi:hypothetical protein
MSTTSPQSAAADAQQQWQASLSKRLSGIAQPELASITDQLSGMLSLDATGRMAGDAGVLSSATNQLNASYDQAQNTNREQIGYGALRAGESRLSPMGLSSAIGSSGTALERDRQSAMRNLQFMSAQSSLSDYNQVLQLLGQGTQASLGLAQGFGGAAGSAIQGLSGQTQMGGILGGAASGAALGSTVYPGWGTLIGGVVGGVAGGLSSP